MVFYMGQNGNSEYHPRSKIGKQDNNSEVEVKFRSHKFEPVMLGNRHGWRCTICGYKEISMFFGNTPSCPGTREQDVKEAK